MKPLLLVTAFVFCTLSCKQDEFVIPIPTVTSFSPASGEPGTLVTISGTALEYTKSVSIGSRAAYFQINGARVEAIVPDGATTGIIKVASASGSASSSTSFEVVPPVQGPAPKIISFAPSEGIVGLSIEITGENFGTVTGVSFNGTPTYFIQTNNVVDAIVPENASTGKIKVTTQNGSVESPTVFTVTTAKAPPQINNVTPGDNPAKWPLLIEGQNLDSIQTITFDGVAAKVDSNSANILTTWVPDGVTPGNALLTLTNKYGVSNSFLYKVRQNPPPNTPSAPDRYYFRKKAKYLPRVQNNWLNVFDPNHSLQLGEDGGTGTEVLNGTFYDIVEIHVNENAKTIILKIRRGTDVNGNDILETYDGEYVDSEVPNQNDPEWQRINFVNEAGRQIIVQTKVQ